MYNNAYGVLLFFYCCTITLKSLFSPDRTPDNRAPPPK